MPPTPKSTIHAILLSLLLSACSAPKTDLFTPSQLPLFTETGTTRSLEPALTKQIQRLKSFDIETTVTIADITYSYGELTHSLQSFQKLYSTYTGDALNEKIIEQFDIYQAAGHSKYPSNTSLITGYFEPIFSGSPIATKLYQYPLYSPPGKGESRGKRTRKEIETKNLLKDHEITYLKDPVDVFVLHVQGSGKLQFPDGSLHSFGYAGNNGHNYASIGKLLVDEGLLNLAETNMDSIRAYINDNPQDRQRVLHHNPRYIFFADKGNKAPVGSNSIELTAERSIAIDQSIFPWQWICFLETTLPAIPGTEQRAFTNFMLPQDSGAAIKGTGRVDIFWGNGERAKNIASHMKEKGTLYFLIKKGIGKKTSPTP